METASDDGDVIMEDDIDGELDADGLLSAAHSAMDEEDYGRAIEHYSNLLQRIASEKGEMSLEMGDVLVQYGFALFKSGQAKNRIFRNRKMEIGLVKKITQMTNPAVQLPDDSFDVEMEDDEDDLELAWQNLETARIIFEGGISDDDPEVAARCRTQLSKTRMRLGDLNAENDQFEEAIADYRVAMRHRDPADYEFFVNQFIQCAVCQMYLERPEEAKGEYESAIQKLQEVDLSGDAEMGALLIDLQARAVDIQRQLDGAEALSQEARMFQDALGASMQANVMQGVNLLGGQGGIGGADAGADGGEDIEWEGARSAFGSEAPEEQGEVPDLEMTED